MIIRMESNARRLGRLGLSIGSLLTAMTIAVPGYSLTADEEAAGRGKGVFERSGCFVCHGNEGSGGVRNRNSATGERVPSLIYSSRGFTDQAFKQRFLQGAGLIKKMDPRGITPPLSMPPFRGRISDEEIADLIAYLKSLTPEQGEEPKPAGGQKPPVPEYMLAGDSCQICHGAAAQRFRSNIHYTAHTSERGDSVRYVCVQCHGDGREHAKKYGDPSALLVFTEDSQAPPREKNAACLTCHQRNRETYWTAGIHEAKDIACVDCHRVMEPVSERNLLMQPSEAEVCGACHLQQRAQLMRSSHMPMREGKVTCSDCHNAHGTPTEKLLVDATVNENCYRCHAEKRGPFLWEHAPVAENCLSCHDPHGSNHEKLLVAEAVMLCRQCHASGDVHVTTPQPAMSQYAIGRSCGNCHSQIHGSNSPAGVQFLR